MWEILNNRILLIFASALSMHMAGCKTEPSVLSAEIPEIRLSDSIEVVTAGDPVRLVFIGYNGMDALLQLDNSYGTILFSPDKTENNLEFTFPDPFGQVAGICSWKLIIGNRVLLEGDITILPYQESGMHVESYLGPKDLIAGSSDRPMVVTIPADRYDNPLSDGTAVVVEERFQGETVAFTDSLSKLIHWRRIQPGTEAGRIFVKSMTGNRSSVEMYTDISAGIATDFEIRSKRNHEYADGNQVLILETSVIKDPFDNIVTDGTQVTFQIQNSNTGSLYSKATTVNGVASAKIVHPDAETNWNITAFIAGAATSNTLEIGFKSAVKDFEVRYDDEYRVISIGPVKGFMGQLVPDYTPVEISIIYGNDMEEKETVYTRGGYSQLDVNSILSDSPLVGFEIRILGLTKRLKP